jgi:hypothetical protein
LRARRARTRAVPHCRPRARTFGPRADRLRELSAFVAARNA